MLTVQFVKAVLTQHKVDEEVRWLEKANREAPEELKPALQEALTAKMALAAKVAAAIESATIALPDECAVYTEES